MAFGPQPVQPKGRLPPYRNCSRFRKAKTAITNAIGTNAAGSGTALGLLTPTENVSGPPVAMDAFAASPISRFGCVARIPFAVVASVELRPKKKPALPMPGFVDANITGGLATYRKSRKVPDGSQSPSARLVRVMGP